MRQTLLAAEGRGREPRGGHTGPHAMAHGRDIEPGSLLLEETGWIEKEELWIDDSDADHTGWFCVRTDPFPCPAADCSFVADYMTAAHLILVWQIRDDPNLLRHAKRALEVGRNPQVVEYRSDYGPSASYYAWEAAGRPVHGIRRA